MAKAFSDAERDRMRAHLMAEARALFVSGGLGAVSLSRITRAAGVAKTSFYAFFPSKEALILDLLADEAPGVSARVMAPLDDPVLTAPEALSRFLEALLSEYATNPFLARLVSDPAAMEAIAARVRPEDLARKADWMERPLRRFFEARIAAGELDPVPVGTLLDLVRSVGLLAVHRQRFGTEERFSAMSRALIACVARGLAPEGDRP